MNQNKLVYSLLIKDGEVVRLKLNLLEKSENNKSSFIVESIFSPNKKYDSEEFDTFDGGYCNLLELALEESLKYSNLTKKEVY